VILKPTGVSGVSIQIMSFDAMMLAADHPPQTRKVALGEVRMHAVKAVSV
jgi:hypothetical protein